MPLQLFEHWHRHIFRTIPSALLSLQVKQFALLPSANFVIVTDHKPSPNERTENLQVSIADASQYHKLVAIRQTIDLVIKNINSRPKKQKDAADSDDSKSDD